MSEVRFSAAAESDLLDIVVFIARDNPRAAREWLAAVRGRCELLADHPLTRDPDDGLEIRDDVQRELCESLPARSIRISSIRFPASVSFRAPRLPPLLHVVDGLLGNPIHRGTSLVFGRHAHAHKQREPPGLVIMQTILCWSVHHVLLRGR